MKRLAVLGQPVSHSRSPAMQTAALEALGLGEEWSYEAIEVSAEDFAERVHAMPDEGFAGANVTIPHKRAALEVAADRSRAAEEIGAANTLSFAGGSIAAENTDATGILEAVGGELRDRTVLVLGAGGSARAAAWALAGGDAEVSVWNRTGDRAEELVRELAAAAPEAAGSWRLQPVSTEQARANGYELIVNCTAVGMHDENPFETLPIDPVRFDGGITVLDLVYAGSESKLLRSARERGSHVIDGLEVLVRQGADSLRIWTGLEPPLHVMREAARAA